jgi:hypothetical protein
MYDSNGSTGNGFYTCDQCGKHLGSKTPPIMTSEGGLLGRVYHFCSNGHKLEYESLNQKKSQSNKNNSGSNNSNSDTSREELELKRQAEEIANQEKKAILKAKSEKLKSEGKPFMAFVVLNQEAIIGSILTSAVLGIPAVFLLAGEILGWITTVILISILVYGVYKYLKEMFRK